MTDAKNKTDMKPDVVTAEVDPEAVANENFDTAQAVETDAAPAKPPRLNTAEIRKDEAAIAQLFEQGVYPYKTRMRRTAYEKEKAKLQVELLKAQRWIEDTGQKVVMLFEGRDAAGKGGTIKRFTEHLNPRTARVVALEQAHRASSAGNGISSATSSTLPDGR